jgi:PAS domain S-box-containing protein
MLLPEIDLQQFSWATSPRHEQILRQLDPRSSILVPLQVRNQTIGLLTVALTGHGPRHVRRAIRRYGATELELLIQLGHRVAIVLDHVRLVQSERQAVDRISRLQWLVMVLSQANTMGEVAEVALHECSHALAADTATLQLLDPSKEHLELVGAFGIPEEQLAPWRHQPIRSAPTATPIAEAVHTRKPIFIETPEEWARRYPADAAAPLGPRGARMAIPLVVEGRVVGGMGFSFAGDRRFDDDGRTFAIALAEQCTFAFERARLFDALRESEQRLRVALSAAEMGTWRWDLRTGQDTRDASLNRLLGVTATESTQPVEDFLEHIHPEDQARVQVELEEAIAGRGAYQSDLRILRRDGSVRWVRNRGLVLCDAAGRPMTMTGVLVDLTRQRRADARFQFLAEASAALASSLDYERTLKTLARLAVPLFADWCAVDMLAEDGTLRRLATHHGDPVKVALALALVDRYPPHPRDEFGVMAVARTGEPWWGREILDEQLAAVAQDDEHLRLLRELGIRSYILVPLKLRDRTLGVLSFVRAETEDRYTADDLQLAQQIAGRAAVAVENARLYAALQASEHEAKHAYEMAKRAERRKDEFLAVLGHELRNPLAPIVTAIELMKMKGDDGTRRERDIIERQVDHLTRLVDDLLDISRITRGLIELRKEAVELGAVITRALEMASPIIERRRQHLAVAVPAEGLRAEIDPVRIAQVVSNLLNNAAKYTPPGGHISVSAGREGDELVIRVRDDGRGMSSELLPTVFELFVQGERIHDRSAGGLGIGLTLVRSIVELHGGRVGAYSEGPGQGSEFVVWLPDTLRATDALRRGPAGEAPARERTERPAETGQHVLVVDDNVDAAETLAEILRVCGYEVAVAHDGPSALELAPRFRPQVALLDIGLPVMDGYELGRRLQQIPGFQDLRLVAITGYDQERDRAQSLAAGFREHLVKPVDVPALLQLLQELNPSGAPARA